MAWITFFIYNRKKKINITKNYTPNKSKPVESVIESRFV
jgi:hypothetical protein